MQRNPSLNPPNLGSSSILRKNGWERRSQTKQDSEGQAERWVQQEPENRGAALSPRSSECFSVSQKRALGATRLAKRFLLFVSTEDRKSISLEHKQTRMTEKKPRLVQGFHRKEC